MIAGVLFDLDGTLYDRNWLTVDLERHFWEAYSRRCEISADTWSTLHALRSAGKCLGIVTNGPTEWQSRKIDGLGLGSLVDVVLISEQEGIRKPDARFFDRARERALSASPIGRWRRKARSSSIDSATSCP